MGKATLLPDLDILFNIYSTCSGESYEINALVEFFIKQISETTSEASLC